MKFYYILGILAGLANPTNTFRWWPPAPPKPPSRLITISPSGLHGYYLLGITSYLKEHFDMHNYAFSGASAGSWISLIMSYRGNHKEIIRDVLTVSDASKQTIKDLGHGLRNLFLNSGRYTTADFDMTRCYMGLIEVNIKPSFTADLSQSITTRTLIYNKFSTLEDAINCCIASSHVPFVMGSGLRKYRDLYAIDGGFSGNPYHGQCHIDGSQTDSLHHHDSCDLNNPTLHIHPFIWYGRNVTAIEYYMNQCKLFMDLFKIQRMNLTELYEMGYRDAKLNRERLIRDLGITHSRRRPHW
jgi:hypothetical protein